MGKANRTHQAPPVIENLGDGSFYYNFNTVESAILDEEGQPTGGKEYNYHQVRCNYPVEAQKIQDCLDQENYNHQVDLTGYEEV